jgi:hypothetical protein
LQVFYDIIINILSTIGVPSPPLCQVLTGDLTKENQGCAETLAKEVEAPQTIAQARISQSPIIEGVARCVAHDLGDHTHITTASLVSCPDLQSHDCLVVVTKIIGRSNINGLIVEVVQNPLLQPHAGNHYSHPCGNYFSLDMHNYS